MAYPKLAASFLEKEFDRNYDELSSHITRVVQLYNLAVHLAEGEASSSIESFLEKFLVGAAAEITMNKNSVKLIHLDTGTIKNVKRKIMHHPVSPNVTSASSEDEAPLRALSRVPNRHRHKKLRAKRPRVFIEKLPSSGSSSEDPDRRCHKKTAEGSGQMMKTGLFLIGSEVFDSRLPIAVDVVIYISGCSQLERVSIITNGLYADKIMSDIDGKPITEIKTLLETLKPPKTTKLYGILRNVIAEKVGKGASSILFTSIMPVYLKTTANFRAIILIDGVGAGDYSRPLRKASHAMYEIQSTNNTYDVLSAIAMIIQDACKVRAPLWIKLTDPKEKPDVSIPLPITSIINLRQLYFFYKQQNYVLENKYVDLPVNFDASIGQPSGGDN